MPVPVLNQLLICKSVCLIVQHKLNFINWRSHTLVLLYWYKPVHKVSFAQDKNKIETLNVAFLSLVWEMPSKDSLWYTMFVIVCQSERELQSLLVCIDGGKYSAVYSQTLDSYALWLSCEHVLIESVCVPATDWISLLSLSLRVTLYVCELNTHLVIQQKR